MTTRASGGLNIRKGVAFGVRALGSRLLNLIAHKIAGEGRHRRATHTTHRRRIGGAVRRIHRPLISLVSGGYRRKSVGRPRKYVRRVPMISVMGQGYHRRRVGRPRKHTAGAWQLPGGRIHRRRRAPRVMLY